MDKGVPDIASKVNVLRLEETAPFHQLPKGEKHMETSNKRYREKLVQQIKDAGEELITRSDTLVHPDLELITDFDITLSFSQDCFPEITFSTSVVNKTACDRLCKKEV